MFRQLKLLDFYREYYDLFLVIKFARQTLHHDPSKHRSREINSSAEVNLSTLHVIRIY